MSNVQLNAEVRDGLGKANVGRIRREGKVPCIMYGVDDTTVSLSVNKLEMEKMISSTHSIIDLKFDGQEQGVVVRDVQYHPVKGNIIHVDFMRIKAGQEIKISVPVRFVGESPGVKIGGVFQELKSELAIITLPKHLPEVIEVDVSKLEIHDAVHVKDLNYKDFTIEDDPEDTICSVVPPKKIEEPVEIGEEEGEVISTEEEKSAEPEVITAKKSESEEE